MDHLTKMFDLLRKDIKNVQSVSDIDDSLITSLWTISIFATMETLRKHQADSSRRDNIDGARLIALKHFDLMLLSTYGITGEDV